MALFSGTVILLEIPSGIVADFIGHKKTYILSVFLNLSAMVVLVLTKNTFSITAALVIMASGKAFSSGSLEAIFINRISASENGKHLEKLISFKQVAIPAGLALGALAGGFLPDLSIARVLFVPLSDFYSLNFLAAAGLCLFLIIIFTLFVKGEDTSNSETRNKGQIKIIALAVSTIKSSPVFFIIMLTTLSWGLAVSGLETFWQPRVFQITDGAGGSFIYGLLTNGYFLAGALGSLISWPLCRLLGNKPLVFLFTQRLFLGGMLFLLSGISGLGWFSVVYIGLFLFNGTSNPVEESILNKGIPSESRATLLSVISFMVQIGAMTGSLVWGYLSETRSIGFTWKICAGILTISSAAYLRNYMKKKNTEPTILTHTVIATGAGDEL